MRKAIANVINRMQHSAMFSWVYTLARKLGLGHLLHIIDTKVYKKQNAEKGRQFEQFYELHEQQFKELDGMLADDLSRRTMQRILEYRKTYDISVLKDVFVQPQYFQKDIFGPVKDEVLVDGGAYVGDTIKGYLKFSGGGVYKKIYAWEPDENNIEHMEKNLRKYKNITIVPCGLWKEKGEQFFSSDGNQSSKIVEGGEGTSRIAVDSIDNVCADDKVTFIKMDIEGSEMEALKGAVNVIKRDKPRLAICIYHEPEHLYEIPFWIKQTVPEYKLYMRQHSCGKNETVIYATV